MIAIECVNNEMTVKTKVLQTKYGIVNFPTYEIYVWDEDPKHILNYLFDCLMVDSYFFVYLPFLEYDIHATEWNLSATIDLILDRNVFPVEGVKENLEHLKDLYDEYKKDYNDKELDYDKYLEIIVKTEKYVNKTGVRLRLNSFYSPLECRHLLLEKSKFDFKDLKSNFKNFKDDMDW